jgi:hypothetical protein
LKKAALVLLVALIIASPALADEPATALTEKSIRTYYADIPEIFQKPYPDFLKAYLVRVSDTLLASTTTTIHMMDNSTVRSKHSMTKDQMEEMAGQAYAAANGAELANHVTSIAIDPSGKSALVHATATIKNMRLPGEDDGRAYIADSTETCIDTVVFIPGAGVQTSRSNCDASVVVTHLNLENQ